MSPTFDIIVATDSERGIGKDGDLPWHLPGDLAHFRRVTKRASEGRKNAVLMGRRTWDSIPERFRPLKGRINVVVTRNRQLELPAGVLVAHSFDEALTRATEAGAESSFVIGGATLYTEALQRAELRYVHLTRVQGRFDCDTHLPVLGPEWVLDEASDPHEEGEISYDFARYHREGGE